MNNVLRLSLILINIVFLIGITTLYVIFDSRPLQGDGREVEIVISEGASLSTIAEQLYNEGVVRSPGTFKIAAHLLRKTRAIYPGMYSIKTHLTNSEAIAALAHARAIEVKITIPEGLRSDEIISLLCQKLSLDSLKMTSLLSDSRLLAIAGQGFKHLEGTLYPETYRFLENSDEYMVLKRMVSHFRENINADLLERAAQYGFDVQKLITFASLVEKETAREDERRLVASVYHNRLKKKMLMNCDPTIIYMLVQEGVWDGNIKRRHFSIDNPYNSYMYAGLPPGPIANPGLASIEASLDPEETDYLYFVGKNDGSGAHDFSRTLREHNNKVNRYQRRGSRR